MIQHSLCGVAETKTAYDLLKQAFMPTQFGQMARGLGQRAVGALKTPVGAGLAGATLGGGLGYLGGREQMQEAAEGPFVALTQPQLFVPSLLQGMDPQQQQAIMQDPQAMQFLEQQVQQEALQMLGDTVLD